MKIDFTPEFDRAFKKLAKRHRSLKEDFSSLLVSLVENPAQGVELFAGVGGFNLGLRESGWKVIFANQWEPGKKSQWAFDCYNSHFPESVNLNVDVATVDAVDIPAHELLVGGFPCQDYSVASTLANSKGIQGKKGVLWWEIYRIASAKMPRFILLENVDRLLKSPAKQRGRDFGIILACLSSLGYTVEWRVINAADYGFPQRRRRTFIFATKDKKIQKTLYGKKSADSVLLESGFFPCRSVRTRRPLPIGNQPIGWRCQPC